MDVVETGFIIIDSKLKKYYKLRDTRYVVEDNGEYRFIPVQNIIIYKNNYKKITENGIN